MTNIKRYDPEHDYGSCWMELHSSGDYVLFEDFEDAIIDAAYDLRVLQGQYDSLVEKINDICRDA